MLIMVETREWGGVVFFFLLMGRSWIVENIHMGPKGVKNIQAQIMLAI